MSQKRRCTKCTVCCTVMGVDEIGKPERQPCPHLGRRGCTIYATRPESCRTFECGWLRGVGTGIDRPDRLGAVLTSYETDGKRTFHVAEARKGVGDGQRVRVMIDAAVSRRLVDQVVIVRTDGRRHLHILETGQRIEYGGDR